MSQFYVLTDYVNRLMARAEYDKLEDGTFASRIPECPGVVAFGTSLTECQNALRSTLEDWIVLGLKLGHQLPIVHGNELCR